MATGSGMNSIAANGQLSGSREKSPSRSNQSAGNEQDQQEDPHITYVELPITVSRAMSPDMNSLADRKDFLLHVPLPAQVVFPSEGNLTRKSSVAIGHEII